MSEPGKQQPASAHGASITVGVRDEIKRSVDALQRLYTIVIGLSLTEGAKRIFDPNAAASSGGAAEVDAWLHFLGLVVTIVPFYHGANRHLDDAYIFDTSERTRKAALIFDFFILFAEGTLFAMMGLSIYKAERFYNLMLALLLVDVIWAGASMLLKGISPPLLKWCLTNLAAIILVYVALNTQLLPPDRRELLLVAFLVIRTVADYALSWKFYIGQKNVASI